MSNAVASFIAGADAVLAEHGEAGCLERWHEHEFPGASLDALEQALARPSTLR